MSARLWVGLTTLSALLVIFLLPNFVSAKNELVYVVPIEETVEDGLSSFIDRALDKAEEDQAKLVIFEINTPGGRVDSAAKIAKRMTSSKVESIAFVNNEALSAGAYLSLNADKIYMVPNSTMGAAAVIDTAGNTAGKKAQSYWTAAMRTAAEQNNRNPLYAQAMADEDIDLPEYGAEKGKLLTFTASQALKAGYSEGTVKNQEELLTKLGLEDADVRYIDESMAEKIARFLTNPLVIPILLTIAAIGIVVELFSPGFGIPGFVGITALLLYFYGHLIAGAAGYETIVLFVLGVILCLLELFVPGGIVGLLGFGAIIGSLFMASDDPVLIGISLLIAITIAVLAAILMVKVFGKNMNFFKKIVLTDSTNKEQGYVSNVTRVDLLGLTGKTMTDLRPAGTAIVGNERLDVVSEGSFIKRDTFIEVVKVEGSRIVVREAKTI
ncbi:nodulation protein NfeD [Peribacillus sp. FSL H8-0477]|uniref:NfeD family protein n=1 Tax=Peribacillus sp. FSL H8-0477 TaxID=2921388 RepID=UPI0030FC9366